MRAYNPALLYTEVSSTALYIDATSPQSSYAQPLIDLQARVNEDALAAGADGAQAAYNTTALPDPVNVTGVSVGYGGVGSDIGYYDTHPISSWPDSDWSGAASSLSFAWRGWTDPESSLDHIEFSIVELREQEGYEVLSSDPAAMDARGAPALLSAEAALSYLQYLASDEGGVGVRRLLSQSSQHRLRRLQDLTDQEFQDAYAAGDVAAPPLEAWNASAEYSFADEFIVSGAGVVPKALSLTIPSYEELYTALADIVSLPLQSALRGQLANPWVFWGGAPLTSFIRGQAGGGDGNVTLSGLALKPGRQYAIALRAYSGSSQFTQVLSDGVRADIPRSVPCFGRIQIGPARRRNDPSELLAAASGTLTGLPRPTPEPQDPNAANSPTGSGAATTVQYTPYADRLTLSLLHFADPYVQRPSALQRLYVCPDVDGYGGDYNSNYTAPGEQPLADQEALYKLSMAPVETYAVRLELMSAPPGTAATATPSPARLLRMRGRALQTTATAGSGSGSSTTVTTTGAAAANVPLHPSGKSFLPGSDSCCRLGAYDRHFVSSLAADVEIRLPSVPSSGTSAAVVASLASPSDGSSVPAYALVGATGSAVLTSLHHIGGASAQIDLFRLGAADVVLDAGASAVVAASKVPSGFVTLESVAASNTDVRRPAFAVAGPRGVVLFEVHTRADDTIDALLCQPPDCFFGASIDDARRLANSERVHSVASIPLNQDVFDAPASSASSFGRAVALHNLTVAIAGPSSDTLRAAVSARQPAASALSAGSYALQLCENAPSQLRYSRNLSSAQQPGPYDWRSLHCAAVTPPSDPHPALTGVAGLEVPYLVAVEQASFGTSLALGPGILAVGAPLSSSYLYTSNYATAMDSVLLFTSPSSGQDLADAAAAAGVNAALGDLMTSLLIDETGASSPTVFPHILLDPLLVDAAADPGRTFIPSSSFGRSVDVDASGSLLLVGAPDVSFGQGMVYAYTLSSSGADPELACYFKGGLAGFSKLGESVSALSLRGSPFEAEAPDGTLALASASFHGLATHPDGTAYETAALAVLAVRSRSDASLNGVPQFNLPANDLTTSPELEARGVPRCPLIAYIGAGETRLDVKLQSGLQDASDVNATAGAEGLLALIASGSYVSPGVAPVVAAGGSFVLLTDAAAPRRGVQASVDDAGITPSSTGRLWSTAFCPRGAVRAKSSPYSRVPYVCQSCASGEASYGGVSSSCSSCATAPSASSATTAVTGTTSSAVAACAGGVDSAGHAADVMLELTDENVSLLHGAMYKVHLRGITASGLWREIPGPLTIVDTTPPVPPSATTGGSGINDGPYSADPATCAGDCNTDLAYTSDLSSYSLWHGGFTEDVSGIDYYMVGASSRPCDGRLWRACTVDSIVVSYTENITRELSDCSQLEVDYRRNLAQELGVSDWTQVGALGNLIPFDLDDGSLFDIAPLTNVGLDRTKVWTGLSTFISGTYAFGCVVAYNRAGLRTALSTTGLVFDTTPPVVVTGSVKDGLSGPDFDQQSMIDGLSANWISEDYESGSGYDVLGFTSAPYPVLDAVLAQQNGETVDWDAVQAAVETRAVHWDSTPSWLGLLRVANLNLTKGVIYYACVRSRNGAGLWSNLDCSDGVTVGKNEVKPDPTQTTAVGFDAVSASSNYSSPEEQRADAGGTVGSLALPPGGLGDGSSTASTAASLLAGVLDDADLAGSTDLKAVNPGQTAPPANNFLFGE